MRHFKVKAMVQSLDIAAIAGQQQQQQQQQQNDTVKHINK